MTPGEDLRISLGLGGICLRRASTYPVEAVDWLWPGWLAKGKFHILAGAPGTGKTTIATALAATLTTGSRWPDGSPSEQGDALIWSGEDDPSDTLIPRMMAAGAGLQRVHVIHGALDEGADRSRPFDPASDMSMLADEIALMNPAPGLLIIDPVVSAVAGDSHKNSEVRRALQPLVDLAMTRKIAVLGITHFSKGTQGRDPTERVTEASPLAPWPVSSWWLPRCLTSKGEGASWPVARATSVGMMAVLPMTWRFWRCGPVSDNVRPLGQAITGSAREILGQAEAIDHPEERNAWEEARDWLLEELAAGPLKASEVQRSAKASGITEKSLRTARERLGIKPHKEAFSLHGAWMWKLPCPKMPATPEDAQPAQENCSGEGHLPGYLAPNLPPRCPIPQSLSEGTLGTFATKGIFEAGTDDCIRVTI